MSDTYIYIIDNNHLQQQQQQQQISLHHPANQQSIRPLMAQLIPTPNTIRQRGRPGRQQQNGRGNDGGYGGHGHQGRRGHGAQRGQGANSGIYSHHNHQVNRGGQAWRGSKRARSPEQNSRDRSRIKLDLEDLLIISG